MYIVFKKYTGILMLVTVAILMILFMALGILNAPQADEQSTQAKTQIQFTLGNSEVYAQVGASFYISSPYYLDQKGKRLPLSFDDSPFSQPGIALLRLDSEHSSQQSVKLSFPAGVEDVTALGFSLGVPYADNHGYPLKAEKPLNDPSMFWTWQQGYKFLRLDLSSEEKRAALHLGATGCESPAPVRPPEAPCAQPNRVEFVWKFDKPRAAGQNWDIALTLDYLDQQHAEMDEFQMCSGMYEYEPFCASWIQSLGLDLESGQCHSFCRGQQLFRLLP